MTTMFFFTALLIFAVNSYFGWRRDFQGLEKFQMILQKESPKHGFAEYTAGFHDGYIELGDKTVFFASWEAMDVAIEIARQVNVPISSIYVVDGGT